MASESEALQRESEPPPVVKITPIPPPVIPQPTTSIPQKRVLIEDDHAPAVRSPLNPDAKNSKAPPQAQSQTQDDTPMREKRAKKESLKKRESKGALAAGDSSRATPEPRRKDMGGGADAVPMRYKLHGPVKASDFDLPQGPVFRSHHEITTADGENIEFFEISEQYCTLFFPFVTLR
jgi:COMPASS component BRE2